MSNTLVVSHLPMIAEGNARWVYPHPEESTKILKVYKRCPYPASPPSRYRLYRHFRLHLLATRQQREIREHLRVMCNPCDPLIDHLPKCHGYTKTDLGLALVMEKMVDSNGGIAPSLGYLMQKAPLTQHQQCELDLLFRHMLASNVIASDIVPDNLVWSHTPQGPRFFIIDGLGEHTAVSTYPWRPMANRDKKRRMIEQILRDIDNGAGD